MLNLLHVVDDTTTPDGAEALGQLLRAGAPAAQGVVVALGHRSTRRLLELAGIREVRWISAPGLHLGMGGGVANPMAWRALGRVVNETKPKVIHAWGTSAAVAAGWAAPETPCVVTLGDGHLPRGARWLLLQMLDEGWGWDGRDTPTRWVGQSRAACEAMIASGISRDVVREVPLAVEAASSPATREKVRDLLELAPDNFPVLLLAGNEERASRHNHGLWVGGIIQEIFPRVRVVVREALRGPSGGGDVGMERLFDRLANTNLARIAPWNISWADLLSAADVLVATGESGGIINVSGILQAMARGVPVVATPAMQLRELITDHQTGLIMATPKPRSAAACIERLFEDQTLRKQMVEGARQVVGELFAAATIVARYAALYAELLGP